MYLIGHAAVGVLAASITTNPAAAFGIGWLSHYVADFIPHGDEPLGEWAKRGNEVKRIGCIAALDLLILSAALSAYVAARGFTPWVLAAAAGSVVPDALWGLELVCKRKLFGPHHAFHHRNHNFFQVKLPLAVGLALQFAVTSGLWWWII